MFVVCIYRYTIPFYTLLVPSPSVTVNMLSIPTVGQPLSLECIMTTVRGITSTIDIIWSRDGVEVKRTTGASITFSLGSSIVYRDFYNISLVTTNEEEKVYQCRGVINATPSLTAENNISLDLVGKYMHIHMYVVPCYRGLLLSNIHNFEYVNFPWIILYIQMCTLGTSL